MPLGGNDYNISATISVVDQTQAKLQQISMGFNKLGQNLENLGQGMLRTNRMVDRAFNSMAMISALISGPLLLATKSATERNAVLSYSFQTMAASVRSISDVIGRAMEPAVKSAAAALKVFSDWFTKLDPAIVKNAVTIALWVAGILGGMAAVHKVFEMVQRTVGLLFLTLGNLIVALTATAAAEVAVATATTAAATAAAVQQLAAAKLAATLAAVNIVIFAVVAALIAMIVWWDKLKVVAIPVLNAIEVAVRILYNGVGALVLIFTTALAFIVGVMEKITGVWIKIASIVELPFKLLSAAIKAAGNSFIFLMEGFKKFLDFLGKMPGALGAPFRAASASLTGFEGQIKDVSKRLSDGVGGSGKAMSDAFTKGAKGVQSALHGTRTFIDGFNKGVVSDMTKNTDKLNVALKGVFTGKQGDLAKTFEGWANAFRKFTSLFNLETGKMAEGMRNFFEGLRQGWEEALKKLTDFATMGKNAVLSLVSGMQSVFSSFFQDFFTGQLKSAQEYFAEFGKLIIKIISDVIAQMITMWIIGKIVGIFGGAATGGAAGAATGAAASVVVHSGRGMFRAHSGLLASDEVPVIAQTGEGMLSRRGVATAGGPGAVDRLNKGVGGGGQGPIVVIQAWDTQDIMRNRKSIEAIIGNAMRSNSSLRGTMKKYR